MAETLLERVWAWLHETFPERQIYVRSDGRVQFFTFGPTLQATIAGLSLIFLGWVAFATVNVVFKDRIIAAKDHRYQQMQSAYENRVADLQISYDELNGALVSAEDRFKSVADELQTKQNTIMRFINRKEQVDATLSGLAGATATPPNGTTVVNAASPSFPAPPSSASGPSDGVDITAPSGAPMDTESGGGSELSVMPQPAAPQPRTAKPTRASFLDLGGAMGQLTGLLFGSHSAQQGPARVTPSTLAQHPALRQLALETLRVQRIGVAETQLLAGTETRLNERVSSLQGIIRRAGIDPAQYARKFSSVEGVGGPEIPLQQIHIDGIADSAFENAYLSASAVLEQMNGLLSSLRHIPLTIPVHGSAFEETSGFGARVDPFTGHYAFHPGVDFAGPWGSTVTSTAPGTVVFAGNRGGYGNMVEIDHGFGIHTRYGHLSSILVQVGARVGKGAPIGRLGSTGRSTGPHVHYEVWYDDVVRNPSNFIEAGRHVLE
jgi:murein DD-endopeptidase MepM/ murein hydrolase activator NlpD